MSNHFLPGCSTRSQPFLKSAPLARSSRHLLNHGLLGESSSLCRPVPQSANHGFVGNKGRTSDERALGYASTRGTVSTGWRRAHRWSAPPWQMTPLALKGSRVSSVARAGVFTGESGCLHSTRKSSSTRVAVATYEVSQSELRSLVDLDPMEQYDEPGRKRQRHVPDEPGAVEVSNKPDQEEIRAIVRKLDLHLQDEDTPHELLMEVYGTLPAPGAAYLPEKTLKNLYRRLWTLPHRTVASKLRFLKLFTDSQAAGIRMNIAAWTSAMNFAGRAVKEISNDDVQSALSIWKSMESEAGIKANAITFNVLFDIATKARKFVLADMLHREMLNRGLRPTRFFRMSLINHHGIKGDGVGVRKAYHDFVESGEVVDSAVVSCVIDAFLKCKEPATAEETFERAKRLHASKTFSPPPPRHWRDRRKVGRDLHKESEMRAEGQGVTGKLTIVSIAPGVQAYDKLVRFYALNEGNIERVTSLINEMEAADLPMHGAIFLHLFKGFTMHGGLLYTTWTRPKLEMMYRSYIDAVRKSTKFDDDPVYVSTSLVRLCLGAFAKCTEMERVEEVWTELQEVWEADEAAIYEINTLMQDLADRSERDWSEQPRGQRAQNMHFFLR